MVRHIRCVPAHTARCRLIDGAVGWRWLPREAVRRQPSRVAWPREKTEGNERARSATSVCSRRAVRSGITEAWPLKRNARRWPARRRPASAKASARSAVASRRRKLDSRGSHLHPSACRSEIASHFCAGRFTESRKHKEGHREFLSKRSSVSLWFVAKRASVTPEVRLERPLAYVLHFSQIWILPRCMEPGA